MKTVMVFGTFDGLHPGHEYFLSEAKKKGDWLVVVVARDQTVKKVKGHLPKHNEVKRKSEIDQTELPDQVVLGSKSNPYTIFNSIKPDIICLGYDQKAFVDGLPAALAQRGIDADIIRLEAYRPDEYKSSNINKNRQPD